MIHTYYVLYDHDWYHVRYLHIHSVHQSQYVYNHTITVEINVAVDYICVYTDRIISE